MNTRFSAAVAATATMIAVGNAFAGIPGTTLIDFDSLVHGEIITNQFDAQGVSFTFDNFNRSFDIGAAFDTTLDGTRDPDLEDPWASGNIATNEVLGRVMILAENNTGAGDGILDTPDDEGSRPAGTIGISFGQAIQGFGLDVIDIEGVVIESSALVFSLSGMEVGRLDFAQLAARDATIAFGDNSANRVAVISSAEIGSVFDHVTIELGGSGAFDNLTIVVPTPGATAILGMGGLLATRRRR